MSTMQTNEDEQRVQKWLQNQGFSKISRSSDDPPDFIVEEIHAVEVTRLESLYDKWEAPISRHIEEALQQLGPPSQHAGVVFVDCDFTNMPSFCPPFPLSERKKMIAELKQALQDFLSQGKVMLPAKRRLTNGVLVTMSPTGQGGQLQFELNAPDLPESLDGFFIPALEKDIRRCICKKSERVRNKNREGCYKEWWLVLVDHVTGTANIPHSDLQQIRQSIQCRDFWSRIIVIGAESQDYFYEL